MATKVKKASEGDTEVMETIIPITDATYMYWYELMYKLFVILEAVWAFTAFEALCAQLDVIL